MKNQKNQAIHASTRLVELARNLGIVASVITKSKPHHRRCSCEGSTSAPQKVVELNGKRMSLAQGRQYVEARRV